MLTINVFRTDETSYVYVLEDDVGVDIVEVLWLLQEKRK